MRSSYGSSQKPEEVDRLDLEPCLFPDLAPQRVERGSPSEETAGQVPDPAPDRSRAGRAAHARARRADGLGGRHRVGVADEPARPALDATFHLLDSLAAAGTELPAVEGPRGDHALSALAVRGAEPARCRRNASRAVANRALATLSGRDAGATRAADDARVRLRPVRRQLSPKARRATASTSCSTGCSP